jgi:hypothetical protein
MGELLGAGLQVGPALLEPKPSILRELAVPGVLGFLRGPVPGRASRGGGLFLELGGTNFQVSDLLVLIVSPLLKLTLA